MPAKVLLVEDDVLIGSSLSRALTSSGYRTRWAQTGSEALRAATEDRPDIVLLDLGLPDVDGGDVTVRLLETWPGLPIIMLTARAEEADVVAGLRTGAVDYVTKPFGLAELMARLEAQLRAARQVSDDRVQRAGDVVADVLARRAWVAEREMTLTTREFDLLVCLLRSPGEVVPRAKLMAEVWGADWVGTAKTLDVHVGNLRRNMGEQAGEPSRISVVRGIGYRLDPV